MARQKLPDSRRMLNKSISLPPYLWQFANDQGKGNTSEWIRELIEKEHKSVTSKSK